MGIIIRSMTINTSLNNFSCKWLTHLDVFCVPVPQNASLSRFSSKRRETCFRMTCPRLIGRFASNVRRVAPTGAALVPPTYPLFCSPGILPGNITSIRTCAVLVRKPLWKIFFIQGTVSHFISI